jgi:hypothetical protein
LGAAAAIEAAAASLPLPFDRTLCLQRVPIFPFLIADRPFWRGTKHLFLLCRMARVSKLADLLTEHQEPSKSSITSEEVQITGGNSREQGNQVANRFSSGDVGDHSRGGFGLSFL